MEAIGRKRWAIAGGLHPVGKLVFRARADLARDRLHPQCRGPRRAPRHHHLLCRSRAGRPLPRDGRRPPHAALALQRSRRPTADPARHRLCVGVRSPTFRSSCSIPGSIRAAPRLPCCRLSPTRKARRHAVLSSSQLRIRGTFRTAIRWRQSRSCWRKNMKIAQIAPLMESVPPRLYGGTERIVSYLTDELVRAGP